MGLFSLFSNRLDLVLAKVGLPAGLGLLSIFSLQFSLALVRLRLPYEEFTRRRFDLTKAGGPKKICWARNLSLARR